MRRLSSTLAAALTLVVVATGCAQEEIEVSESQTTLHATAQLFRERCGGCHTLDAAGSRGSKPEGEVRGGERTNGPNFNTRHVEYDDALFAIRNGGFSGAIMPANIVVGRNAEEMARFLDRYSGTKADPEKATSEEQQGSIGGE